MIGKILNRLISITSLSRRRKFLGKVFGRLISRFRMVVLFYNDPDRSKVFDLINSIKQETVMLLGNSEAYQIYMAAQRTHKVAGDIAEVGVYKGGSAKLICEAKGERPLHLFDTFEGIPEVADIDHGLYKGKHAAVFEAVKDYLKGYEAVNFYKGLFPGTAEPLKDSTFSFVHLDVDTYSSTADCLDFFYPRMNRGGVILSHDYTTRAGVRKAFDEFFGDKPEPIIEMSGSQCLIVKV